MFNETELLQKNKKWILSHGLHNIEYQNGTLADYFGVNIPSKKTFNPFYKLDTLDKLINFLATSKCLYFYDKIESILRFRQLLEKYPDYYIIVKDLIKIKDYLEYIDKNNNIVLTYQGVPFNKGTRLISWYDKSQNKICENYLTFGDDSFKQDIQKYYSLNWAKTEDLINGPYSIQDYENLEQKFKQEKRLVRKQESITI